MKIKIKGDDPCKNTAQCIVHSKQEWFMIILIMIMIMIIIRMIKDLLYTTPVQGDRFSHMISETVKSLAPLRCGFLMLASTVQAVLDLLLRGHARPGEVHCGKARDL